LTRWSLVVIIVTIAGCAAWAPSPRPSATVLVRADRLVAQGQYADALEAYEEILAKYGDTDEAGRARSSRETVGNLLAARAQIVKLTAEVKAQEAQMKAQDAELARARQEITRLTAEADRLRADLENLKKIDIDLERRRK
jgi:hypothetical protein